jgi:hypothetical protein
VNESGTRDPMDPFEREIADSLRRRADEVPATPLGYTDVQRRILQRRRRTATWATAAITLPAVVGLGYLAGRRGADGEQLASGGSITGVTTTLPAVTTTTWAGIATTSPAEFGPAYRCQASLGADGTWEYFALCEYLEVAGVPTTSVDLVPGALATTTTSIWPLTTTVPPATTLPPTSVPAPTIDAATLAAQVLVLDASGGRTPITDVAARLGASPRYATVASRMVEETLVMPLGADVAAAYALLERFGVGGFDTWTPDLVATPVPEGVTVVLVIGLQGLAPSPP